MLQDFREGLLDSEAEAEVRRHLEDCPVCREELESFEGLQAELSELPLEADPGRDLWPQIAWRVEGSKTHTSGPSQGDLDDGPITAGSHRPAKSPARFSLSGWQLLAASIALAVVSGGSVWAFLNGRSGPVQGPTLSTPSSVHQVAWDEAYQVYDQAVTDLEVILDQGRELLHPETVRVLEENLSAIDLAIQEARAALDQDPSSAVLQRFLAGHLRKKVDLLRQAAGAVNTIS
jgi:hypothetical protein